MATWLMLLLIAWHVNSAPMEYDDRSDYRLTQPYEYGFTHDGFCIDYADTNERPTHARVLQSIATLERGFVQPSVTLYEDGSCENGN
jgi:hypothetical protein